MIVRTLTLFPWLAMSAGQTSVNSAYITIQCIIAIQCLLTKESYGAKDSYHTYTRVQ